MSNQREYHYGVVATLGDDGVWTHRAMWIDGDDSPFPAMDQEVYDNGAERWECAHMRGQHGPLFPGDGSQEQRNFDLLEEAIEDGQERLNAPETSDEYNGWANRETWATELHLSNDEMLYRATLDLLDPIKSPTHNGERIEAWVTGQVERQLFPAPGDEPDPWGHLWRSMISDVGSFWRVDWASVARAFLVE